MKIKLKTISEFQNNNFDVKVYLLLLLASTFCGNTWLLSFGTYLLLVVVTFQFCLSSVKGFTKVAFLNRTDILLPILLLLFSTVVLCQGLFLAFNKNIAFNSAIRFYMYSFLLIFIPNYNIALLEIRIMKYYSLIAGFSGLFMTFIKGRKTGGLLGNYQALGMMMSVACVLFAVDYFLEKDKINIRGYILSLLGIFISGKRTFALLALASVFLAFRLTNKNAKKRKFFRIIIIGGIVVTIAYIFVPVVRELFNRFISLSESGDDYTLTSGRSDMWQVAVDIFKKNKISGIGFGNFAMYTAYYYADGNNWAGRYATHNIYYGLLCETGIIGIGLMVSFMLSAIISTIILLRKVKKFEHEVSHLMYYSIFLQLWFIVYGFTGNGIYDVNEFLLYIFAVSILMSCKRELRKMNVKS